MPRKWRVDGDEDRLPEGVIRTGYDADTQTYTYSSVKGEESVGQAGQRYGELTLTRAASSSRLSESPRTLNELFGQAEAGSSADLPETFIQPEAGSSHTIPDYFVQPGAGSSRTTPDFYIQPEADSYPTHTDYLIQPEAGSSRTPTTPTKSRVPSRSRTMAEPRRRHSVADRSSTHGDRAAKKTTRSSTTRTPRHTSTHTSTRESRRSRNPDPVITPVAAPTKESRRSHNPDRHRTLDAATTASPTNKTTHLSPNPTRKRNNQTFSAIISPSGPPPTDPETTPYPRRMSSIPTQREAPHPKHRHRHRHSQPAPPPRAGVAREFCREAGGYIKEVTVAVVQKMTRGLKKRKEALRVEREAREERERMEDEGAGWV